ncbi:DMT family transporter [Reyranella sp. CPCC 100927]|uniref:DMT family transporter n=1 Tax=Reyranella sp. CPCC 100927 TaxID=2599616 RepID=UPI0011B43F48|nr:EamA family transporter [Reyranella sp. CPCC 100927]TWT06069.1 EamA family transporter [Reyranella sp. CPCC 100927]
MKTSDIALALVVMAIWGLNFVAVKIGVQEIPPVLFVTLRFAFAFLLMVPFVPWPTGRWRELLVLSFVLGSLHFTTMFTASRYLEAGTMAVVTQLQAVFSALLGRLWFGERLGTLGWIGMAIAFGGVLLIAGEPSVGDRLWALGLPVLGCAFFALYHARVKRIGNLSANVLNCWVSLLIVPQTLAISLAMEQGQVQAMLGLSWNGVAALLYQVVPMVIISYWAWYRLLYRYPLTRVAPFQMLVPLFGVLAGALVLGEPLTVQKIAGGAVTVVGVALVVLRPMRDKAITTS